MESPSVASMSEADVVEYRRRREITVEGRDVPKPVKSFDDVGFPGIINYGIALIYIYIYIHQFDRRFYLD